ncbi:uncharacterized protein [Brachyistius frenatus]|uniref:uncharacterized protein n=1 Tax=Brachyistius frenatus TaxID=100188 RepID=UPI0037E844A8
MGKLPKFLSHLSVVLQQANLSCSSYRTLFTRLDMAMATVSLDVASSITYSKMDVSKYIPPGCIIYSGECNVTITNETDICVGVNSTELQLHLDSRKMSGRFCNFAVEEFACASLSGLKAEDLAEMLKCNRTFNSSGSRAVWKLLLSKTSHVLDEALDLLSNMTLDPSNPAVSMVLDSIREIRLDTIDMANLNDPALIQLWFNRRLRPFLPAVSPEFLSCLATRGLNCSTYQHIVQILSRLRPHMMLSRQMSVYTHFIKSYLTRNNTAATKPRCYNPSDPQLNSTAWFVEYVGPFVLFLTLEDLQTFGSEEEIQKFTVNPLNIALFNHSALPLNLTNYYTQLIYQQDSNFHPLLLPVLWLCVVPGSAFSQLTVEESRTVLYNLTTLCTELDPQVSAALAGNFGENIDATVISTLGNESIGMSTGQIKTIKPEDLLGALSTLSSVIGWNEGQAKAIVQVLSGMMKINSSSSLVMLGSLVVGVPANVFGSIDGSELITAWKIPSFLTNIMTAPQIVQQTFVTQIISVNTNSESIIQNVPDELATEIPRVLLLGLSSNTVVIEKLNKKKWKQQQAELFFSVIAVETATAQLGGQNNLSSSVLQGFTCTAVRTIQTVQIKKLVKACRRKGKNRVTLMETQLTCMYNYIKGDSDATVFSLYPTNVLLYYDYSLVPPASCRSYFKELADADFSVFSSALSYKRSALFDNARSCLGITNTSLTEDNVEVLGNMCCTLDGSYIQNSHQSILEKLKGCSDISDTQTAAVETLLISGNTRYGAPSTWNQQTLRDLDMLPLYLTRTFYGFFNKKTKRRFLSYFLKVLRGNKVERQKRRKMRREIRRSSNKKSKPSIVTECTAGNITQVTIRDDTFPFDYDDINQFDCCLSATTVRDNLGAITEKVDQEDYLEIVLRKLREAYNSTIPEDQVQVLAAASREATTEDINMWTITQIDTLAALMDSSNGPWDPSLAKAIISKYLSYKGNKLGSAELNVIGGANLCSLDADVLKTISTQSLKETNVLDVSNCTTEKKRELFTIARQTFNGVAHSVTIPTPSYQLTKPYVGGATLDYVQSLAASNISMDLPTFTSLDQLVILNLNVNEVRGLLGTNLPDLKSYENETVVQNWVSRQFQSDVETLGVGLSGGRADPTTPSISSSTPSAGSGSSSSTASNSATTGNGSRIRADAGFSLLVLLALLITSQQAMM